MRADWGIFTGLLGVGLGLAYWASLPAKDADADKVTVWDVAPDTISEIVYKTGDYSAELKREGDTKRFWVSYERKANEKDPKSKPETDRFLASEEIGDVLSGFHPFKAQRSLGTSKDEQLVEFGLKDSVEVLTVKSGDKTLELRLGKKSYGSRNQFAVDPKNNQVLIVDGKVLQTLGAAKSRLYERRLTATNWEEVTKGLVEVGSKKKAMLHVKKEDNTGLKWTDEGKDAAEKPSYGSWMDKVGKLRALNFATSDEAAAIKDKVPFLIVSLEKGGAVVERLEFRKGDLPQSSLPATNDPAGKAADRTGYFVTSQFLQTPVRLASSRMEPIEKDIPAIVD